MATAVNKKYGKLVDGELEYAPVCFKQDGGLTVPGNEAGYNYFGYKLIVREKPEYDPATQYLKLTGYEEQNDGRIHAVYEATEIETTETEENVRISKLYLEIALMKLGLYDKFNEALEEYKIDIGDGVEVSAKILYDKALVLQTSNEMFEEGKAFFMEKLGLTEETAAAIIQQAVATE